MIKINKAAPPPEVLVTKGKKESASNKGRMTRDPQAYKDGKKKFSFQSHIYGDAEVKSQAKADQFDKCCSCESKLSHAYHGDIEHFRPKGSIRADRKLVQKYGYYWLAYSWENLLFSCALCNQTHKRDAFPLKKEKQRAEETQRPKVISKRVWQRRC